MNLFKLSRTALVAGLVVTGAWFSAASAQASASLNFTTHKEIAVTVRESSSFWDNVSMLAQGIGTVTHRDPRGNVVIRLFKGVSYEDAMERLEGRANVVKAEPIAPQAPIFLQIRSVKGLRNAIEEYRETYAQYRAALGEEKDKKEGKEEGEEGDETPGLDYIESYLQYMEVRAYPGDDWDGSAYYDWARTYIAQQNNKYEGYIGENRDKQVRLAGPGFNPNFQGAAAPNWTFIGGTDINAPYRIYFGLSPVNGRVNAVAFHPTNPNTFLAGGAEGGVWRTTDAGVNWTPLGDAWPTMGVNAIAYKPNDPNVILVGTGDLNGGGKPGIGIMRTTDGGTTWTATGTSVFGSARTRRIVFDPDNNNIVYATTATGNVVRSTDAGATWTVAFANSQRWTELAVGAPRSGGRNIWAGAGGSGINPVLYRSQDQGVTWTAIALPGTGTGNIAVAASPVNPDTVYVMRTGDRQIYKSINAGATWTNTTTTFPNGSSNYNWSQSWYDWYLRCSSRPTASGNEDVLYAGL
ncbi:MAG: WD40/YVTN/BNR-like repeat-containing protein, partial [Fimbriimonadaceae bacterium]